MVREQPYTSASWRSATYLAPGSTGSRHGVPVSSCAVPSGAILANTRVVRQPKDWRAKRVGVTAGTTVTTGVWARGVLADEHGRRPDRVMGLSGERT